MCVCVCVCVCVVVGRVSVSYSKEFESVKKRRGRSMYARKSQIVCVCVCVCVFVCVFVCVYARKSQGVEEPTFLRAEQSVNPSIQMFKYSVIQCMHLRTHVNAIHIHIKLNTSMPSAIHTDTAVTKTDTTQQEISRSSCS